MQAQSLGAFRLPACFSRLVLSSNKINLLTCFLIAWLIPQQLLAQANTTDFIPGEISEGQGSNATYTRDDRGLELSRTKAAGTSEARTITTEWHPQFRLPKKITEPNKITEYIYDAHVQTVQ